MKRAALVLTAVCLLGLFSTEIADSDFWWHLKTGQYLVETHRLPVPDPFSYTAGPTNSLQHFNLTHEWLAQAIMYGVYALGGFTAVILVRALLLTGMCALAGALAARLSGDFYLGIAAAFASASLAVNFAADRPGLATFFFVALFLFLLEWQRAPWLLPPLMLLWANCHSGFFLGWLILLAYSIRNRRLWPVAACAIAISAVNPNGFGVISTLLAYRKSPMTANLVEWSPPLAWGPPYSFDLLFYTAVVVLAISWRKVRLPHWILFAAFSIASWMAFRNVMLTAILAPVLIAAYLPGRWRTPRILAWAVPPAIAIGILAGIGHSAFFQLRTADWTIPAGAADYLLANHIRGPIFNTYEQGGYLIWRLAPQLRVFIDGRALNETVYRDYHQILFNEGYPADQITGPRAELLDRYGVEAVVMNALDYPSGALYPLAIALANPASEDWYLAYEDAQAVVFLRRPAPGTMVLANKLGRLLKHLDTECESYLEHSPDTPLCARTLADYWMRNQAMGPAQRMMDLYRAHKR